MNTRLIGLILGGAGIFCLLIAMVLGVMIGINEQTQTKYWQDDDDVSEDDYDKASESAAFLNPTARGLGGFGMGILFAGIGLAIAGGKHGNLVVLIVAILAVVLLFAGLIMSIYMGAISRELEVIENKDDYGEGDGDRIREISSTTAFLQPFNFYFSGFIFGSFGMGLALFTILMGAFLKPESERKTDFAPPPREIPAQQSTGYDFPKSDDNLDTLF